MIFYLMPKEFVIFDLLTAEISRQLVSSKPKITFTLPEIYGTIQAAKELAKHDCRIVTVKTRKDETIPSGAIDFTELMSTKGNRLTIYLSLFDFLQFFDCRY